MLGQDEGPREAVGWGLGHSSRWRVCGRQGGRFVSGSHHTVPPQVERGVSTGWVQDVTNTGWGRLVLGS